MGVTARSRTRVRDELVRVVHRRVELPELVRLMSRSLARAVPFDGTCVLTLDPATLLPTGEVAENALPTEARLRLTEIELGEPDFNKFTALAEASVPAASLSAATDGELDRSRRQREVRRPHGFADELRSVLTGPTGQWGALTLLREAGRPFFTPGEVRFVGSLAPILADGLRRALLAADTAAEDLRADTGFVVVAPDDTVEVTNAAAEEWLDELVPAGSGSVTLPIAVRAILARTRNVASGGGELATSRVRTRRGRWVMVRGSFLDDGRVVVLLESAGPAERAAAIVDAYGFTPRERTITELVARGLPTTAIAEHLHLAPYTVQDHLKAIFAKSGTRSRGELVARLFFDHPGPLLAGPPPASRATND